MNSSPVRFVLLGAFLVGWAAWSQWQNTQIRRELADLRQRMDLPVETQAVEPRVAASDPSIRPELLALRGDIAALSRRLAELSVSRPTPGVPGAPSSSGGSLPPALRKGFIERAGLPATVMAAFQEQLGGAPFEGATVKQSEGRAFFQVDTRLADGRGIELVVNGDGQVVNRTLETPLESLSAEVQRQVADEVGSIPVRRVTEVFEDGRTTYRVQAKDPKQAVQLVFSPDGDLLQAEVTRRDGEP